LLNVRKDETYETLESRFEDFVRETLIAAKSAEDPVEVAYAIIRSVGRRTGDTMLAQNYPDQLERERLHGSSTLAKNTDQSSQSGPHMALMRAWRIFLEALAQQQPLIIIIDDLQWADEALLDLLEYLTDRITDVPILFLCPARPDLFDRRREWGGGRRNFTTIVLESLSREESSDLVNELLKTEEIPGVLRYTILNRAEGNPFFVEEIVRMLIDQKVLVKEDGSWRIGTQNEGILSELASPSAPPDDTLIDLHYVFPLPRVPDTIQGVLAARVDLLSPVEKRVLQHACIIGRTFWLSALIELASDLPANIIFETLDQLVQRDFVEVAEKQARSPVENDQVFTIKHILIRDVVYNNIPRMRRSQEHAQLAIWLEEKAQGHVEAFAELLAYHYQQALSTWSAGIVPGMVANHDSQGPAASAARLTRSELRSRVITYTVMAGDQALHSYFTIRAIQAYSEALELLIDSNADSQSIAAMHEKLGGAYTQRGNLDEAWQEYRRALQLVTAEGQEDSDHLLHLYNHLSEGDTLARLFQYQPQFTGYTYIHRGRTEAVRGKADQWPKR